MSTPFKSSVQKIFISFFFQPADLEFKPIPYSFNYEAPTEDGGSSGRQESGDGSGIVRGSYTVNNLEGHTRVVEYEAGPEGFRAFIRTNEPGTDNSAPADVVIESSAPEAKGPIITYGSAQTSRIVSSPGAAPAAPTGRQNSRYVLVPSTDPRAQG